MKNNPRHWPTIEQCESSMFDMCDIGICVSCGDENEGREPDTSRGRCESCGEYAVFGLEECAVRGWVQLDAQIE